MAKNRKRSQQVAKVKQRDINDASERQAQVRLLEKMRGGKKVPVRESRTVKQVCVQCGSEAALRPAKQVFFDERWLAKRWGVTVKMLQAQRQKGNGIPFTSIGSAVRYRLRDIVAYERAQKRSNTCD